ncbi:hypothetical protein ES708_24135 [subsurface metagenome]
MKKKLFGILITLMLAVSLLMVPAVAADGKADLLEGSFVCEQDGWLFVHLEGTPYQIGYQNGYLVAESANYWLTSYVGTGEDAEPYRELAQIVWPMIPEEYQDEIDGIVDGLHAAGYTNWDRWDVVGANAWADEGTYEGGCSAFAATGDATTDGQIVLGHITMSGKAWDFMYYVMFDVTPDEGYRFRYQSAGASIWSGQDWYLNETGLIVAETSLHNRVRDPEGTPVFVRIRQAVQYTDNIDDFITVMTTNNSGSYPNEWLVGDAKTGEICSLMLGCNAWDINRTFDGFYPSCNYPYYENFRIEAGYSVPAPDPPTSSRALRWLELIDEYYGEIDVEVGKLFFEDDIISSYGPTKTGGGYDGKVSSTDLVLDDMGMWARWGNAAGKPFDLEAYLAGKSEEWIASHQEYIANLQRYVDRTPQPWTYLIEAIGVDIDIKPGSDPNSINLESKGVVPVAVLTTDDFDASSVDPESVAFAGAGAVRWTLEDVDGDGDMDMLFHFKTQKLDLTETSFWATLTGTTYAGPVFQGTDTVNIVPTQD